VLEEGDLEDKEETDTKYKMKDMKDIQYKIKRQSLTL
jgi:hypothetical protein